jgi:diguanylate cyclase (GGDEF)-like protein
MDLAETIRATIEALHLPHPRSPTSSWITVSIGVATIRPHQLDNREALFVAADRALYVAKEEGRNQVRATNSGSTAWETVKALILR